MKKILYKTTFLFLLCICKVVGMAGYEVFPHMNEQQIQQIENQSIVNYNYSLINLHHINQDHLDCSTYFKLHLQDGKWVNLVIDAIPQNLTLMQAIRMAITRVNLIPVTNDLLRAIENLFNDARNNQNKLQILQRALDINLNEIQNFQQMIQGNFTNFIGLIRDLGKRLMSGGYGTYTAAVLHYIKFNNVIDDFLDDGINRLVQHIIIHITLPIRVSKNIRELSLNSLDLSLQMNQGEFYNSLKHKLKSLFAETSSATVISYGDYQDFNVNE